jgi:hypothetical protein
VKSASHNFPVIRHAHQSSQMFRPQLRVSMMKAKQFPAGNGRAEILLFAT